MEGFTYVDIFATKGPEYLLVISILLTFILFWKMLSTPAKKAYEVVENIVPAIGEWFRFPTEDMYFHQGHVWAKMEDEDVVKVGIDDFAQKLVGKIDSIKVPEIGSAVTQGGKGWTLKVDSKSIDMLSPVDGKILAINRTLVDSPESINEDPYGDAWLMKVQVPEISANMKNLLSGKVAGRWMEEVKEDLFSRMNYNLGTLYQDGGVPVNGIARNLNQEKWDEIAREFFLTS